MDFCSGGDLGLALAQDIAYPEATVISIALQLSQVLQAVHALGLIVVDVRFTLVNEYRSCVSFPPCPCLFQPGYALEPEI
jgi:serine/threonine protein kinase